MRLTDHPEAKAYPDALKDPGVHRLTGGYRTETRVVVPFPGMVEEASSPQLGDSLADHRTEIQQHLENVYLLLRDLAANPGATKCGRQGGRCEGNPAGTA